MSVLSADVFPNVFVNGSGPRFELPGRPFNEG